MLVRTQTRRLEHSHVRWRGTYVRVVTDKTGHQDGYAGLNVKLVKEAKKDKQACITVSGGRVSFIAVSSLFIHGWRERQREVR